MEMARGLKIWVFCIVQAVVTAGSCPGKGGCKVRQLGSPDYTTSLLQCSGANCQRAVFAPSPSPVCIIRYSASTTGKSAVRIYLNSCSTAATNEGYLINNEATVVPWNKGRSLGSTMFSDISCATFCNAIDLVIFQSSDFLALIPNKTQISLSANANCQQAFYVYPNVIPAGACEDGGPTGPTGSTGTPRRLVPKKQCYSHTRQRARLTLTDGVSSLAVGSPVRRSDGSYHLPIVEQDKAEVFYVQSYISQAIGSSGTIESVTAYTLQLARSRKYLIADELDDTTLNITTRNSTGLNFEDASEFPGGYAQEPDSRLFIAYHVSLYNRTATFFCPLFHRNFCLFPIEMDSIGLLLLGDGSDSLEATFTNHRYDVLQDYLRPPSEGGLTWLMNLSIP